MKLTPRNHKLFLEKPKTKVKSVNGNGTLTNPYLCSIMLLRGRYVLIES